MAEGAAPATKKDTVNEVLRHEVLAELRRRHVDELADGALPDLADADIMASAWRCHATCRTGAITGQPTEWIVPRGIAGN